MTITPDNRQKINEAAELLLEVFEDISSRQNIDPQYNYKTYADMMTEIAKNNDAWIHRLDTGEMFMVQHALNQIRGQIYHHDIMGDRAKGQRRLMLRVAKREMKMKERGENV